MLLVTDSHIIFNQSTYVSRVKMSTFLILASQLLLSTAQAGCDSYVTKASKQSGADLVRTFDKLAKCDKAIAEDNFLVAFLPRATDVDTLVALSETAITLEVWNPTWKMLGKIQNYSQRNDVASQIGKKCSDNQAIVNFLQGGYFALKNIEFSRWSGAYLACDSDDLRKWLITQVESPPSQDFSEKYNTLMDILVKEMRVDALPHLQTAAMKAAETGGPFDSIITNMNSAVQPGLGEKMSDSDRTALEDSLLEIAKSSPPDKAQLIAKQLNTAGSSRATELLPIIYADRMSNGKFTYGAAAVEAGECKGKKMAYIHYAEVSENGKRIVILEDVTTPLRSLKPKLKKCETSEWPISATSEPIKGTSEIDDLVEKLKIKYEKDGYEVKMVKEKKIILN
jgi:hypothetical protein